MSVAVEMHPQIPIAPLLIVEPGAVEGRLEIGLALFAWVDVAIVGKHRVDDDGAVFLRSVGRKHAPPLWNAQIFDDLTLELGTAFDAIAIGDGPIVDGDLRDDSEQKYRCENLAGDADHALFEFSRRCFLVNFGRQWGVRICPRKPAIDPRAERRKPRPPRVKRTERKR